MKISDIAKKAKVSPATVDRVLHNRGRVSEATKKLVREIIQKDGFEPNQYARNLRLQKKYKFGILIREFEDGDDGYWSILHDGCAAAAKDMKSLSAQLVFGYFGDSPEESLYNTGMRLLEQNIDGLVLAPNSPEEVKKLLPQLGGIPYAFVNTSYPEAAPLIDTSQNCLIAGRTAAKIMMMLRPAGKVFTTVSRESRSNNTVQRTASFRDYFSDWQDITINNLVISHTGDINEQIRAFLSNHPQPDGIFVVTTSTYLYMDYFSQLPSELRPAIIGYDAVPKNIALLESNRIDCLISQQPFSQGYNALQQLYLHQVLGSREIMEKRAPVTVLFSENLASYKTTIRERFY